MKRVREWLPVSAAVFSLVLFFFLSISYPHGAGLGWANNSVENRRYSSYGLAVSGGELFLGSARETWPLNNATPQPMSDGLLFTDRRIANVGRIGATIGYYHHSINIGGYVFDGVGFCLPCWLASIGLILPPFLWIAVNVKNQASAKKLRRGICLNCGYDLRATPDRCPECGTIPPKKGIISN